MSQYIEVHDSRISTPLLPTLPASVLAWRANIFSAPRREPDHQLWMTKISWPRWLWRSTPWDWWQWVSFQCWPFHKEFICRLLPGLFLSVLLLEEILLFWFFAAVASCALFIWDYIITFGMEVDLVWRSKWGFVKGLYLVQRYLPFIDTVWLTFHGQFGNSSTFFPSSFFSSNENGGDKNCVSEGIHSNFRFVQLACSSVTWSRADCIFLPVLITIGFTMSEGMPDFRLVFRVVVSIDI